jgi:methylmalonyl-CoA carboxyltransferase 5S subunit
VVAQAGGHANKAAITCRPADLLEPSWERWRTEAMAFGGHGGDEDVLTYAMFPKAAAQFFQTRTAGPKDIGRDSREPKTGPELAPSLNPGSNDMPGTSRSYVIRVGSEEHRVTVTPSQ